MVLTVKGCTGNWESARNSVTGEFSPSDRAACAGGWFLMARRALAASSRESRTSFGFTEREYTADAFVGVALAGGSGSVAKLHS